jgi:hypothetical protein
MIFPMMKLSINTDNHSNVFTFILPSSAGQTGGAWEPAKKLVLFPIPPPNKNVLSFSRDFAISPTLLLFLFTSSLSHQASNG